MLKYFAKISMDIFPSVLATIIGAYIVNHYINARPAPDAPAAVTVAPAEPNKDAKPGATDVANLPAPSVKAKGVSEKGVSEKGVSEKSVEGKPADAKSNEAKPAETASTEAAAPSRGHQQASREKGLAKATPAPVVTPVEANAAPVTNPVAATPDANDLARAAIERLRKSPEAPAQETAHAVETPHVQDGPRVVTAAPASVRPLPPPITVSSPASDVYGAQQPVSPPYTASVGGDDANRPTPPADIPVPVVVAPPLDLRADAAGPMPMPRPKTNVADQMLSGVKSMFHAVLPKGVTPD